MKSRKRSCACRNSCVWPIRRLYPPMICPVWSLSHVVLVNWHRCTISTPLEVKRLDDEIIEREKLRLFEYPRNSIYHRCPVKQCTFKTLRTDDNCQSIMDHLKVIHNTEFVFSIEHVFPMPIYSAKNVTSGSWIKPKCSVIMCVTVTRIQLTRLWFTDLMRSLTCPLWAMTTIIITMELISPRPSRVV